MAIYTIDHKCGHRVEHNIVGPTDARQSRIEWLGTTLCAECYRAEQLAQSHAATSDMVELVGTPRQVEWAITLRANIMQQLAADRAKAAEMGHTASPEVQAAIDAMVAQTSAKFWIENAQSATWKSVAKRAITDGGGNG